MTLPIEEGEVSDKNMVSTALWYAF